MSQQPPPDTTSTEHAQHPPTMDPMYAGGNTELLKLWDTAVAAFCDATNQDPLIFSHVPTTEEIQQEIEQNRKQDEQNAKSQALSNVWSGLGKVGEIAKDVVAEIYPPVGYCYSATKLLVELAAAYKKSFSTQDLENLLSSMGQEIMDTFGEYARRTGSNTTTPIPDKMTSVLFQLMTQFLDICTECAKLAKSSKPKGIRKKLRVFKRNATKVIAGEDAAVQSRKKALEALLHRVKTMAQVDAHLSIKEAQKTVEGVKTDVTSVHKGVVGVKTEVSGVKTEVTGVKTELHRVTTEITGVRTDLSNNFGRKTDLEDSNRDKIKKQLAFDEKSPSWNSWKKTYENLQNLRLEDTGKWIISDTSLANWADTQKSASTPVVALEAPNSSGKTHLCFPVLKYLGKPRPDSEGQTPQVSVAHFFFKGSGSSPMSTGSRKGGVPLRDAFAGLVLQLTEKDVAFQTFVAEQCRQALGSFDAKEIWDNLIMAYSTSSSKNLKEAPTKDGPGDVKPGKIFFLVIDGLETAKGSDQDPDGTSLVKHVIKGITELHQGNSKNTKRKQPLEVRLFITGTPEYLQKVLVDDPPNPNGAGTSEVSGNNGSIPSSYKERPNTSDGGASAKPSTGPAIGISRILLCEKNHEDLHIFIQKKGETALAKLRNFKNEINIPDFISKLIRDSQSSYSDLLTFIEEIEGADDEIELQKILECESLRNIQITGSVQRRVDMLFKTSSKQHVDDFNEILPWIVLPERWPDMDQLEAVLHLKHGVAVELRHRVETVYGSLLECNDAGMVYSFSTMEYFQNLAEIRNANLEGPSSNAHKLLQSNGQTSNQLEQFDRKQLEVLQEIISSFCGNTLFSKSGLHQFFKQSDDTNIDPPGIWFDNADGHCRIILSLLKAICPENREDAKSLHRYAIECLLWHLGKVSSADIVALSAERKREIGRWLYAFFMHEKFVHVWFVEDQLPRILSTEWWKALNEVLRWLRDPAVGEGAHLMFGDNKSSMILERKDLMERACEILASEWLLRNDWDPAKALKWILQLPKELVDLEISDETRDQIRLNPDKKAGIFLEHILAAESWAMEKLKGNKADSVSLVRIVETMAFLDIWEDVPNRCQKVLDLDARNWKAQWYLARALHRKSNHEEASKRFQELMKNFREHPELRKRNLSAFENIYNDLWECMKNLKSFDVAAEEAIKANFSGQYPLIDFDLIAYTLDKLRGHSSIVGMERFFNYLSTKKDEKNFTALLLRFVENEEFHDNVSAALRNKPEILLKGYRKAIKSAAAGRSESDLAYLRFYYALALLYPRSSTSVSDEIVAEDKNDDVKVGRIKNIDKARKALRSSVDWWFRKDSFSNQGLNVLILGRTIETIGFAYVQWAHTNPTFTGKLEKLESLKKTQDRFLYEEDQLFAVLIARTYQLLGQRALAKQHVRNLFHIAFELLDDGAPENDWNGYKILAQALTPLGEKVHASAAWSLVSLAVEDENEPEHSSKENMTNARAAVGQGHRTTTGFDGDTDSEYESDLDSETERNDAGVEGEVKPRNGLNHYCDGLCGFWWRGRIEKDMYVCMDCADVQFEKECWEKLQAGSLEHRVCSPEHEFFRVEKWTKTMAAKMGKSKVRVGNEIITIDKWLEDIRKEYLDDVGSEDKSELDSDEKLVSDGNPESDGKSLSEGKRDSDAEQEPNEERKLNETVEAKGDM